MIIPMVIPILFVMIQQRTYSCRWVKEPSYQVVNGYMGQPNPIAKVLITCIQGPLLVVIRLNVFHRESRVIRPM